ncbi:hypothetical protein MR798_10670, partial [bacterium]|nr:hypothetical protein [bacterium]
MGKYQKNIEAARRITVMQYLETYHPSELVRKTDREYCTRTHDAFPFYRFVDAASPEELADYVSACKARVLYDTGISAEYGDKRLTLSTSDTITDNGRLLVIA